MTESWTTDQPTVTGLYWAYDGREVVVVDVYMYGHKTGGKFVAFELGMDYANFSDLTDYTHWIGPLPKPEPPTL